MGLENPRLFNFINVSPSGWFRIYDPSVAFKKNRVNAPERRAHMVNT